MSSIKKNLRKGKALSYKKRKKTKNYRHTKRNEKPITAASFKINFWWGCNRSILAVNINFNVTGTLETSLVRIIFHPISVNSAFEPPLKSYD